MSAAKEIRNKIKSIKNTQKITKAMEMVAASKMRRAQERMRQTRPYGEKIRGVCAHLVNANAQYKHPFLVNREGAASEGYIVVTSDKGLCGGLNTNVLRLMVNDSKDKTDTQFTVIGGKGANFINRLGQKIISQYVGFGDQPDVATLLGAIKPMLDAYKNNEVKKVSLLYTDFINTVKQEPVCEQLLPVPKEAFAKTSDYSWDYIYEPEAEGVIDLLLSRYVEAVVYQSLAENIASEQAARMVAMKAATDNAGNLINELQLAYNKSRQASITQEISEIVGGAAAV